MQDNGWYTVYADKSCKRPLLGSALVKILQNCLAAFNCVFVVYFCVSLLASLSRPSVEQYFKLGPIVQCTWRLFSAPQFPFFSPYLVESLGHVSLSGVFGCISSMKTPSGSLLQKVDVCTWVPDVSACSELTS